MFFARIKCLILGLTKQLTELLLSVYVCIYVYNLKDFMLWKADELIAELELDNNKHFLGIYSSHNFL
jgi:hypothetical protein